jgi:capsular polysaccharide biosynthesis protein
MNNKIEKNEINQILNTIFKYKSLIFGITIIFIILAFLYASFVLKPIYQADILLKIAKTNTAIIDNEDTIVEILRSEYNFNKPQDKVNAHINSIIKPKYSKGVIRIYARGHSKENIKDILYKVIEKISKEHNSTVELYIKDQHKIIANVKQNILDIKSQKGALTSQNLSFQDKIKNINNNELALVGVYSVSMLRNDNIILELNKQIINQNNFLIALNTTLQPHRTFNTKISGGVHFKSKAITPSKKLIVILGFVTGLLFSILLALFLQFLRDRRE